MCAAEDVGAAALDELAHRDRRAEARRTLAREMFNEPGTATDRALQMIYELLDLSAPHVRQLSSLQPKASIT